MTITNGSFESGWHHHNGRPELQIPNGFTFWDASESGINNPWDAAPYNQFVRPEVRVLPKSQVPAQEHAQFFADGEHTLKIFKGWGAHLTGLEFTVAEAVNDTLVIPVFGDFVEAYSPEKRYVGGGFIRPVLNREAIGDWQALASGELGYYEFKIAAQAGDRIMIQFGCPYALMNSGLFTDGWHWKGTSDPVSPVIPPSGSAHETIAALRSALAQASVMVDQLEASL